MDLTVVMCARWILPLLAFSPYRDPQLVFLLIRKVIERHHSLMRMSVVHRYIHMVFIWSIIHLTYC